MIALASFSYKNAPVEYREKLALSTEQISSFYHHLDQFCLREAVVISTCNRVEFILETPNLKDSLDRLLVHLSSLTGVELDRLQSMMAVFSGRNAVGHLFRVSSALESMVLGEPQILGQVKTAWTEAQRHQHFHLLDKLFVRAFRTAKRVRTHTRISENAVSVSFAAVELARRIFDELAGRRCMLLGAGEMCELAAKHLHANGVQDFVVANRTLERAQRLADQFQGRACTLGSIEDELPDCDIVVSSTGASEPVITRALMKRVMRRRGYEYPMFFIDIAVPRDVEQSVNDLQMVYCYDIDDLQQVVEENKRSRQSELSAALKIVDEEIEDFEHWHEVRALGPMIAQFRAKFEKILQDEIEQAGRNMDEEQRQHMQRFGRALTNKFLHAPSARIRHLGARDDGAVYVDAFRKLFDLE